MFIEILIDIANQIVNSAIIQEYCTVKFGKNIEVMLGSTGQVDISELVPIVVISNTPSAIITYQRLSVEIQLQIYIQSELVEKVGRVHFMRGYLMLEELAEKIRYELIKKHGGKMLTHQSFPSDTFPLWYCQEIIKIDKAISLDNF